MAARVAAAQSDASSFPSGKVMVSLVSAATVGTCYCDFQLCVRGAWELVSFVFGSFCNTLTLFDLI